MHVPRTVRYNDFLRRRDWVGHLGRNVREQQLVISIIETTPTPTSKPPRTIHANSPYFTQQRTHFSNDTTIRRLSTFLTMNWGLLLGHGSLLGPGKCLREKSLRPWSKADPKRLRQLRAAVEYSTVKSHADSRLGMIV